jgi:hypothetical protein
MKKLVIRYFFRGFREKKKKNTLVSREGNC